MDHRLEEFLAQRVYGIALGYEDLYDHDALREDVLLAVATGKQDPLGLDRLQDNCHALAAPSTLNRLEISNTKHTRYHKLTHDPLKVRDASLEMGVRCLPKDARDIILDLDLMGHLVHGLQEGRHFSKYYDGYCYRPLYVVCGSMVLWAQLRRGEADPKEDVLAALRVILPVLRRRRLGVRVLVRGDCGFCREELMIFCEGETDVYYVLGLAKNSVLVERLEPQLFAAAAKRCVCGLSSARVRGVFLSDPNELEPGATGRRQGGSHRSGSHPTVRRDEPAGSRVPGGGAVGGASGRAIAV